MRVDGAPVALTPTEFGLLARLARRPGAAVPRGALAEALDPDGDDPLRTLDVHVSRLRRKLGAEAIETVRGVGYRLGVR